MTVTGRQRLLEPCRRQRINLKVHTSPPSTLSSTTIFMKRKDYRVKNHTTSREVFGPSGYTTTTTTTSSSSCSTKPSNIGLNTPSRYLQVLVTELVCRY